MQIVPAKAVHGFVVFLALVALGTPADAQSNKCAAAKIRCVAKKAACLLAVEAKARKKGLPPDAVALQRCRDKFDGGIDPTRGCFEKLEDKGGCLTFDDTAALEAEVDATVLAVVDSLDLVPGTDKNQCTAKKLKCASRRAACLLGVESKARRAGTPPDPARILKCDDKFDGGADAENGCFAKLETKNKGPCLTFGDSDGLEPEVDESVEQFVCLLDPGTADCECGNGTIDPGEDCDDGGTDDGDCCDSTCRLDPLGFPCADTDTSDCQRGVCDGSGVCVLVAQSVKKRKNYKDLTAQERENLVNAIKGIKATAENGTGYTNTYDKFVQWHKDCGCAVTASLEAHSQPFFLVWHRELLRRFEEALRTVDTSMPPDGVPDYPDVTLPYWRWNDEFPSDKAAAGDKLFMGGDGDATKRCSHDPSLICVTDAGCPPGCVDDPDGCGQCAGVVTTGPFGASSGWNIKVFPTAPSVCTNDATRTCTADTDCTGPGKCVNPIKRKITALSTVPNFFADVANAVANIRIYDSFPWNRNANTERSFRRRMEQLHDIAHPTGIGGTNLDPRGAAEDPVFWLHHTYVDYLYAKWQAAHPKDKHYLPDPPIGSTTAQVFLVNHNLHDPMGPWKNGEFPPDRTPADLLDIVANGYCYE